MSGLSGKRTERGRESLPCRKKTAKTIKNRKNKKGKEGFEVGLSRTKEKDISPQFGSRDGVEPNISGGFSTLRLDMITLMNGFISHATTPKSQTIIKKHPQLPQKKIQGPREEQQVHERFKSSGPF